MAAGADSAFFGFIGLSVLICLDSQILCFASSWQRATPVLLPGFRDDPQAGQSLEHELDGECRHQDTHHFADYL